MPELPEVETIRKDLAAKLCGLRVQRVAVYLPKIVTPAGQAFVRALRGARILAVRRRAKLLRLDIVDRNRQPLAILIHLKMTGQLVLRHKRHIVFGGHPMVGVSVVPNKYTRVVFYFTNGDALYFNDVRQFGYVKLVSQAVADEIFRAYGLEPLAREFTRAALSKILRSHKTTRLKALLLDQRFVGGLGNIYVDEACFRARVRPSRRAGRLTPRERRALWRAIRGVIALSLKHRGTSFNTYVDSDGQTGNFWRYRQVYARAHDPCKVCGTIIKRTVLVGRGTHYCPTCQK